MADMPSCSENVVYALAAIATAFVECARSDEEASFLANMFVSVADSITLLQIKCDANNKDFDKAKPVKTHSA